MGKKIQKRSEEGKKQVVFDHHCLLADIPSTGDSRKCEEVQELPGDSDQAGIQ